MSMYLHTPALEAGSWWRVDTASGSDTGTTVYAYDGTGQIPNYYVLTGSTVRNTTWEGTARFWSATVTLYCKELTYQGVPTGTVVTSVGVLPPSGPSGLLFPVLGGPNTWTGTQDFTGATVTGAGSGGAASLLDRGNWATSTVYAVGDVTTQAGQRYAARVAHTSGTFATDLAASKWVALDAVAALAASNNLSDLVSASAGRTALSLGTAATVNTGTSSGNVPLLSTGGRLDPARLGSGAAAGTVLYGDGSFAAPTLLPGPIEDATLFAYGHSYLGHPDATKCWPGRVQKRAGAGTLTNNYTNGGSFSQTLIDKPIGLSAGQTWTPNTKGVVFMQALHNSVASYAGTQPNAYTVDDQTAWKATIRSAYKAFQYDAFFTDTDVSVTNSSGWTTFGDSLAAPNATATLVITTTKTRVAVLFLSWDGASAPATFAVDINGGGFNTHQIVGVGNQRTMVELPVMPSGTNTITIKKVAGTVLFSGYVSLQATTYPSIVMMGEGDTTVLGSLTGATLTQANANRQTVNGLLATVAAEFAGIMDIQTGDPSSAWNTSTMIETDGIHPNAVGGWVLANTAQVSASKLTPTLSLMG